MSPLDGTICMDTTVENRLATARDAAEAGGASALSAFRSTLAVETKSGPTDFVTQADRDAQSAVVDAIHRAFPDEPIVGEEDAVPGTVPAEGPAWIVDPIDGTSNFVREIPVWTTAVAAVVDGEPVAAAVDAPALGDRWSAGADEAYRNGTPIAVSDRSSPEASAVCPTLWWNDQRRDEYAAVTDEAVHRFADTRRFGSAQFEFAQVAAGGLEATLSNVAGAPWDTVAGAHLVRAAGGRVTDVHGDRWRHDSQGIVATNELIHEDALAVARAGENVRTARE